MKKLFFSPLWKTDKIEKILHDFELSGWRLTNISYSFVYEFVEATPKNAEYIITYNMAKDKTAGMYDYEYLLLSKCSADKIQTKFSGINIYRITTAECDFSELKKYRNGYFKHIMFQYMLISFLFFLSSVFLFWAALFEKATTPFVLSAIIYTSISTIFFVYRIYGYLKVAKS